MRRLARKVALVTGAQQGRAGAEETDEAFDQRLWEETDHYLNTHNSSVLHEIPRGLVPRKRKPRRKVGKLSTTAVVTGASRNGPALRKSID